MAFCRCLSWLGRLKGIRNLAKLLMRPPALILARDFIKKSGWHGFSAKGWLQCTGEKTQIWNYELLSFLLDRLLVVKPERRLGAHGVQEAVSGFGPKVDSQAIWLLKDIETLGICPLSIYIPKLWGDVTFETLGTLVFRQSGKEQRLVQIGHLFLGAVDGQSPKLWGCRILQDVHHIILCIQYCVYIYR